MSDQITRGEVFDKKREGEKPCKKCGTPTFGVTKVDGRTVGQGEPGPITRQLIEAFHELVSTDAPED